MTKNFNYAELSENQVSFLTNYRPKNDMFTSTTEMKMIISKLGLDETSDVEVLRSIRNSSVRLYDTLMKSETLHDENGKFTGRTEKFWDYNTAMQSVTAVIDHTMYSIDTTSV